MRVSWSGTVRCTTFHGVPDNGEPYFPIVRPMRAAVRNFLVLVLCFTTVMAFAHDGRPPHPRNLLELALVPEVQKELKLDEARIAQLQQLSLGIGQKAQLMRNEVLNLMPEEREKRFQAFRAEIGKKVEELLNRQQMSRLRQLDLQLWGNRALVRKDVQDCLKLAPEQRLQVQTILQAEHDAFHSIFQSFRPGQTLTPEEREAFQKRMSDVRELRRQTDCRLAALLTEPQKKRLTAMQGTHFTFPEFGHRGPGG